ncbi:low molecular weight phosphotyrosine protein phosphatase [Pueribacillus theae]|uniref:protein-tyrosine-phosphatase n=1 Tax=Pueribacillus theae TaxID=2171751 RepID=A0A2U1JYV5_9BACI|nr:low molecular weight protein-tyrosine-phosphatase [Pueribacillus theae]PWA10401.1 low molecular weight phosphotyrosine protein phosphatase [Pueribacillus theae]
MARVLFVCLGNICRSPMAEAIFRDMVNKEGLGHKINIESAGTGSWHVGSPPHKGTATLLSEKGISTEGMKARQIVPEDADKFDYIIAMDSQNLIDIKKAIQAKEGVVMTRLLDLVEDAPFFDVPDPYFTGDFDEVYELVVKGCQALLERIKNERLADA